MHQLDDLKLAFWNSRSILKHASELQSLLTDLDIFVSVETWLKPINRFAHPGFIEFRQDRLDRPGGGILILLRNNIKYTKINQPAIVPNCFETCTIKLTHVFPNFNLTVCYRAPSTNPTQADWDNLFSTTNNNEAHIFVGDFNAHNIIWNCERDDRHGKRLFNCISDADLFLHNYNSKTHIDSHTGNMSNLDLIISTTNIADKIDVEILDDTLGSDHFPIKIKIKSMKKTIFRKKSHRLTSKKTDWLGYSKKLSDEYTDFLSLDYDILDTADKYKYLVNKIYDSAISHTPPTKLVSDRIHRNPVAWWDNECARVIRVRKAALKKWLFTKDIIDHIEYKKKTAVARKILNSKKRDNFRKFTESINLNSNSSYVWKKCKILKNKWANVNSGRLTSTPNEEKINEAINKICPPWVPTNPDILPDCVTHPFFDVNFTFSEFTYALRNCNSSASPGSDQIDYDCIINMPTKIQLILLDLYNEMFANSKYPLEWQDNITFFIKKADGSNVRPISLTSCLCKLFERLVKNRLQWWTETERILPASQSGFRTGRSCTDNLAALTLSIEEAFGKKKDVLAAFLDVKGAFDNVLPDILVQMLASLGCSHKVVNFIKFLTYERTVTFNVYSPNKYTSKSYKGLPQGGVLSPLLYIIYVHNILKDIPATVAVSQFADDIALYTTVLTPAKSKKIMEQAIERIKTNLREIGLELSPDKTKLIHFNNKGIPPGLAQLKVGSITIKSSLSVQFLGIYFDYDMQFKSQVEKIRKSCFSNMNVLKFIRGIRWGSDPMTLIKLFKSLIRSVMDYACFIYFPKLCHLKLKLERIQYCALRYALGHRCSTPTNITLGEAKCLIFEDRTIMLCQKYICKIMTNNSLPITNNIKDIFLNATNISSHTKSLLTKQIYDLKSLPRHTTASNNFSIYLNSYESLMQPVPCNTDLGISITESRHANAIFKDFLNQIPENSITIFTDGSKIDKAIAVGAAYICPELNKSHKISVINHASIYTAECMAIDSALDLALDQTNKNCHIFTDSLSVIRSLQNPQINAKANFYLLNIREKVKQYITNPYNSKICFYWIPSHIGIELNDRVDALAKEATRSAPSTSVKIPYTDIYNSITNRARASTCEKVKIEAQRKGTEYFDLYFSTSPFPWFHNKTLTRQFITWVNRGRANHYHLAASLARIGFISDKQCSCGYLEEDLDHVIWNCPKYEPNRTSMINSLLMLKARPPHKISTYLQGPNIPALAVIFKFLVSHELYT